MDKVNHIIQEEISESDDNVIDDIAEEVSDDNTSSNDYISTEPMDNNGNQNHIERINPVLLSEVVAFLERFQDCFKEIESDKIPSFQKVSLWRYYLLNEFKPNPMDSHNLSTLKAYALNAVRKIYKTDILHHVAVLLHPKFKHLKMLNQNERNVVHEHIKTTFQRIQSASGNRSRFSQIAVNPEWNCNCIPLMSPYHSAVIILLTCFIFSREYWVNSYFIVVGLVPQRHLFQ